MAPQRLYAFQFSCKSEEFLIHDTLAENANRSYWWPVVDPELFCSIYYETHECTSVDNGMSEGSIAARDRAWRAMDDDTTTGEGVDISPESRRSFRRLVGLTVAGTCGILVYGVVGPFLTPALRRMCLPYVPATTQQVAHVLRGLQGRRGKLVDLGSGDGRLVLAAANKGFRAVGVELNWWLVWYSRWQARRMKLAHLATFQRNDLWKVNLGDYDNIIIFGVDAMMLQLEGKLNKELGPSGCVLACRFPLPNWKPSSVIGSGLDTVWIYIKA